MRILKQGGYCWLFNAFTTLPLFHYPEPWDIFTSWKTLCSCSPESPCMSWSSCPKCPFPPSLLDQLFLMLLSSAPYLQLTTQKIKISLVLSSSFLFFSFLGLMQLDIIGKLLYWISVLHQTVCSLQAGIMSVLFTGV